MRRMLVSHRLTKNLVKCVPKIDLIVAGDEEHSLQWIRFVCLASILERELSGFFPGSQTLCLNETLRMGAFADHVQVCALSQAFQVDVYVVHRRRAYAAIRCSPDAVSKRRLFVLFSPVKEHYDALLPVSKRTATSVA